MMNTKLIDRRQGYRYPIQLQIDLVLGDGAILSVESINISSNGLQFCCDSWLADKIEPRGIQNHPLDHVKLKIVAKLPVSGENNKLYAGCQVVVARRISQEEYLLGLEFTEFEVTSEKVLEQFIRELYKSG